MKRFNIRWTNILRTISQFLLTLSMVAVVACSSSSRQTATTTGTDDTLPDFDTDSLGSDTFDTSTLPDIDTLFDSDTTTDPLPEDVAQIPVEVSDNEFSCLASDTGFGFPGTTFGTTSGSTNPSDFFPGANFAIDPRTGLETNSASTQSLSCLDPRFGGTGFDQNPLFNASANSFGLMNICVQIAAANPPRQGASQQEVQYTFAIAQLAMIRCFREINQQQAQVIPWAQPQVAAFQRTDHNLWTLISILGNGVGVQTGINGY